MTQLAYLEEPARKTAVTEVTAVRGQGVLLARSIHYAPSHAYGHAHPADRGHFLVEGHKLKLVRVSWRRRELHHVVRGPVPSPGARVLAHLDWPRRHLAMRAHAAMHLVAHAVAGERRGAFTGRGLTVQGGGNVTARLWLKDARPEGVAEIVQRVNQWVRDQRSVTSGWFTREAAAKRVTPQHVDVKEVAPGEPTIRMVDVADVSRVPCDAPLVASTREVGRVEAARVRRNADGTLTVQFRVRDP